MPLSLPEHSILMCLGIDCGKRLDNSHEGRVGGSVLGLVGGNRLEVPRVRDDNGAGTILER